MSKNRIKYFESDSVLEEFYNALANADERKLEKGSYPQVKMSFMYVELTLNIQVTGNL